MMRRALLLPLLLVPAIACKSSTPPAERMDSVGATEVEPAQPAPAAAADPVSAMKAAIRDLEARPEVDAERVKVQHILVSFQGAPRVPATRSKAEAEKLAGDLFAQLGDGASFQKLMETYSDDDKVVGQYLMTATGPTNAPTSFNRRDMVPAFGETGWRLQIGEVGVAPWDAAKSPFGWHIVKRLE